MTMDTISLSIASDNSNGTASSSEVLPDISLSGRCSKGIKMNPQFDFKVKRQKSEKMSDFKDAGLTQSLPSSPSGPGGKSGNNTEKRTRKSVGSTENKIKKTSTVLEKEAKKQKMAEEKLAKQTANELNKIYKPGECMKYMNIELHPLLAEAWYMADVPREVSASGAKLITSSSLCNTGLIMWTRNVPQTLTAKDGQVTLAASKQACARALFVSCAGEVAAHVRARSLAAHVRHVRDLAACSLTLVVFGVKDYFKSSSRKTMNSSRKLITEIDLEMAIADLLVSTGCDAALVNTSSELALLLVQTTKGIAEAPHKKAKQAYDEEAEFYMKGDNKKCVTVDKDGNGVSRLWQQMIAVLPMSSLETSRALCAQYTSPLALYEALQSSNSVSELADVGVARSAVPGSIARRLGPEFARKLHTIFTAEDGSVLTD